MRSGWGYKFVQLRGDLFDVYNNNMKGVEREVFFFFPVFGDRPQGEGWKLCQEEFKLDIKKKFFSESMKSD